MNRNDLVVLLSTFFVLTLSALGMVILLGMIGLLSAVLLLFLYGIVILMAVRIVREYERLVIFRLGRCIASKGPGLVFVLPILERAVLVDVRERFHEVAHESCITKDNAKIDVDFLFYWKIINPMWSQTRVQDLEASLTGLATGLLRAVIGLFELDEALAQREEINEELKDKLEEVSEHWGVTVTTVEIRELVAPQDIQDAMHQQLAAERVRRATITQAQGEREAAILHAEGQAMALERLYRAAKGIDPNTLRLKDLEALTAIGTSSSTKFVVPIELFRLIRPYIYAARGVRNDSEPPNSLQAVELEEIVGWLKKLAEGLPKKEDSKAQRENPPSPLPDVRFIPPLDEKGE